MKSDSSVAVSIPVHAWTPHFRAVLGSLKIQTVPLEIAVMMTQEDPRILEDLENSGLEFQYTRTGPDAGQAAAIAEGWAKTHSPILAWLNTDDTLTGDILPEVVSAFEQDANLDVFYGQSTVSDEGGTIWGQHPAVEPLSPLLRRTNIISQPSCFFRRQAVEAIGGINPKLHYTMDWDLWLRLYEEGSKFKFSEHVLSNVTWAAETKTASLNLQRLVEFGKILRRTQPLHKVAIGLSAVVRNNRLTYKSGQDLAANSKPLIAADEAILLPIVNMHSMPKTQLHVRHEPKNIVVTDSCGKAKIATVGNLTQIELATAIKPGAAALLCIQGDSTKIHQIRWL